MKPFRLPMPLRGLHEDDAFADQPQETTRDVLNMRDIDPVTGLRRLSQRAGSRRYCPDQVSGSAPVRNLGQVTFGRKTVTYSSIADPANMTQNWKRATPTGETCRNLAIDRESNVFALDGKTGVIKYNSDGERQYKLSFPAVNPAQIVRALAVDGFGGIYAAVSQGGRPEDSRIWKFQEQEEGDPELDWEIEPEMFVEEIRLKQARLYTIQNNPDRFAGKVVVYADIDSVKPRESWQADTGYPQNGMDVGDDGSVFIAFPPFADRGKHPNSPNTTAAAIGWTPDDLNDAENRIWSWFKAEDIVLDTPNIKANDKVLVWRDSSGNGRDVFQNTTDGKEAPRYKPSGLQGYPSVNFNGVDQEMEGHAGTTLDKDVLEQNLSALPGYTDSAFAVVIVARPSDTTATARGLLQHYDSNPDAPASHAPTGDIFADNAALRSDRAIALNYKYPGEGFTINNAGVLEIGGPPLGSPFAGNVVLHDINYTAAGPNGDGPHGMVHAGNTYDNVNNAAVITWVCGGDQGLSSLRINGHPIDSWQTGKNETLGRLRLGATASGTFSSYFGEIYEIIVIHNNGSGDPVSKFNYPDVSASGSPTELRQLEGYALWKYGLSHLAPSEDAISISGAAYTNADRRITQAGAFTSYTTGDNHQVHITTSGTPANLPAGTYEIESVDVSGNYIVLVDDERQTGDSTGLSGHLNWPHPYRQGTGPPVTTGGALARARLSKTTGIVAKFDQTHVGPIWAFTTDTAGVGEIGGGVGYAVRLNSEGDLYCAGPQDPADVSGITVRKLVDDGDNYSKLTGDGAWAVNAFPNSNDWDYEYPRIDVDEFDNVWLPHFELDNAYTAGQRPSVIGYQKDPSSGVAVPIVTPIYTTDGDEPQAHAVAVDPAISEYEDDFGPAGASTFKRPERIVFASRIEDAKETVRSLTIIDTAQLAVAPRETELVGVAGGDIVKCSTTGTTAITDGANALDSAAQYIDSAQLFGERFFTDGRRYRVYQAKDGKVVEWKSKTAGKIPPRNKLITVWNGRIVLGHSADDPQNWHMSARDNAYDWDQQPVVPKIGQAVSGNDPRVGRVPDIINAIVPQSEDWLIFLCDHTIYRMTGDPTQGGVIELVSDVTGGVFGRSWCKDEFGNIYFAGSRGGIFSLAPGSYSPTRISEYRIDRRLSEIALGTYRLELEWDDRRRGVIISQVPYGSGGTLVRHWFWSRKYDSWWEDEYGATGLQPTCTAVVDGDAVADRHVLLGCEDGYVRRLDDDAPSDDYDDALGLGSAIPAHVLLGPHPRLADRETKFQDIQVTLSTDQDGCTAQLYGENAPDVLTVPLRSAAQIAGRNRPIGQKVAASHFYLKLLNNGLDQRFAVEEVYGKAALGGRQRVR